MEERVLRARRTLRAGPARLSALTGVPERTVSRILRRHGILRLWECDPLTGEPLKTRSGRVVRYERERPGLSHRQTCPAGQAAECPGAWCHLPGT